MPLEHIRIVLVNPTHPGNIGATARAMKNMGLSTMYLVGPSGFPGPEATARASGADDILAAAKVVETFPEALVGCRLVVGTSARGRRIPWPALDPGACAEMLVRESEYGEAALVFGPEKSGLSNDQLDRCQFVVNIPASSEHPSLNLAGAVLIMAYEIFQAARASQNIEGERDGLSSDALATPEDMDRFYQHLEEVLVQLDFLDPDNPRKLMRRLHRLFNRARFDNNELNILRGILTAVQAKKF